MKACIEFILNEKLMLQVKVLFYDTVKYNLRIIPNIVPYLSSFYIHTLPLWEVLLLSDWFSFHYYSHSAV